jgi:hypothetical protein
MQEGEIFGGLGKWFENNLPHQIHSPVFDCNVCMSPWYGSMIYVLIWGVNWQWPVVVIAAMGLNILYNRLNVAHALSGIEDQIEGIKGEIEEKL